MIRHVTHPDQFILPSFSICCDFKNLIDFQKVKKDRNLDMALNEFFKRTNVTEAYWNILDNEMVMTFFGSQMNLSDLLDYTKDLNKLLESISVYGVSNLADEDQHLSSEQLGEKYVSYSFERQTQYWYLAERYSLSDL